MKRHILTSVALSILVVVAGAGAAHAESTAPDQSAPLETTVSFPELGFSIPLSEVPELEKKTSFEKPSGTASLRINPITIGLCNAGFGDVSVANWNSKRHGKIDLRCGDRNSGYVHIRTRHQGSWQGLITYGGGGAAWDDLMAFSVGGSLRAPAPGLPKTQSGGKACYSTPLVIKKTNGQSSTWNPTIIISTTNKKIITAYPSRTAAC